MKAKQKLDLVVAQYLARARDAVRVGDNIADMAAAISEEGARQVLAEMQEMGLIDADGVLTQTGAGPDLADVLAN